MGDANSPGKEGRGDACEELIGANKRVPLACLTAVFAGKPCIVPEYDNKGERTIFPGTVHVPLEVYAKGEEFSTRGIVVEPDGAPYDYVDIPPGLLSVIGVEEAERRVGKRQLEKKGYGLESLYEAAIVG